MAERFLRTTGLCLSGPSIWALHFGLLYGVQHVTCELSQQYVLNYFELFALFATFICIIVLWLLVHRLARLVNAYNAQNERPPSDNYAFLYRVTWLGAMLATVAMLWAMFAVLFLPEC